MGFVVAILVSFDGCNVRHVPPFAFRCGDLRTVEGLIVKHSLSGSAVGMHLGEIDDAKEEVADMNGNPFYVDGRRWRGHDSLAFKLKVLDRGRWRVRLTKDRRRSDYVVRAEFWRVSF